MNSTYTRTKEILNGWLVYLGVARQEVTPRMNHVDRFLETVNKDTEGLKETRAIHAEMRVAFEKQEMENLRRLEETKKRVEELEKERMAEESKAREARMLFETKKVELADQTRRLDEKTRMLEIVTQAEAEARDKLSTAQERLVWTENAHAKEEAKYKRIISENAAAQRKQNEELHFNQIKIDELSTKIATMQVLLANFAAKMPQDASAQIAHAVVELPINMAGAKELCKAAKEMDYCAGESQKQIVKEFGKSLVLSSTNKTCLIPVKEKILANSEIAEEKLIAEPKSVRLRLKELTVDPSLTAFEEPVAAAKETKRMLKE